MSWCDIGEFIKAVAPIFTAGAACCATWIGWRGLEKWRYEMLGKRKAEIAEATLAKAYEMEEILREARLPWVLPYEMAKKDGIPDEIATDANYAPEARLIAHQEFFGRFRSQKHAFAAVFGRDAAKPLDELWRIRIKIHSAVVILLQDKDLKASTKEDDRDEWKEYYTTAFDRTAKGNDKIGKLISEHVSAIERSCHPAIEASVSNAKVQPTHAAATSERP